MLDVGRGLGGRRDAQPRAGVRRRAVVPQRVGCSAARDRAIHSQTRRARHRSAGRKSRRCGSRGRRGSLIASSRYTRARPARGARRRRRSPLRARRTLVLDGFDFEWRIPEQLFPPRQRSFLRAQHSCGRAQGAPDWRHRARRRTRTAARGIAGSGRPARRAASWQSLVIQSRAHRRHTTALGPDLLRAWKSMGSARARGCRCVGAGGIPRPGQLAHRCSGVRAAGGRPDRGAAARTRRHRAILAAVAELTRPAGSIARPDGA